MNQLLTEQIDNDQTYHYLTVKLKERQRSTYYFVRTDQIDHFV